MKPYHTSKPKQPDLSLLDRESEKYFNQEAKKGNENTSYIRFNSEALLRPVKTNDKKH
jgi:hypothetical protein